MWIGGGCLGVHLLICDPLVNGAGDAMLHMICDFFVIGHLFASANMNKRVEVIAAEAKRVFDRHVRLEYLSQ